MERRRHERQALSGKVQVERRSAAGGVASMSVFLREMSVSGFSGTYVGPTVPGQTDSLAWRHDDGASTPVRLVWSRKTLDCIHHVGFEVVCEGDRPIAS
jgi:hypothetical protein